jgi:DNA-binding protein H-NS
MTKQNTAQETAVEDAMTLINGLELPYLVELSKRLEHHIEKRRKDDIVDARRRIQLIAQEVGLSVDELIEMPVSGVHGTRPPQFADPDNASRTWSGHGRKPFWIRDLEQRGYTLDQLRIAGADAN